MFCVVLFVSLNNGNEFNTSFHIYFLIITHLSTIILKVLPCFAYVRFYNHKKLILKISYKYCHYFLNFVDIYKIKK